MKKRVKKLWVEALRSGGYKQGRKRLRYGDTYCCLGVLCDLYRKETGEGKWNKQQSALVTLNDVRSFDFNGIADHIEKEWWFNSMRSSK